MKFVSAEKCYALLFSEFLKSEGDIRHSPASSLHRSPHPYTTSTSLKRPPPLPSCSSPDFSASIPRYPPTIPEPTKLSHPYPLPRTISSPDFTKPPPPRPYPSTSPELQGSSTTHSKAPLPKPRQRKPSRSDNIEPTLSPTRPAKSTESSPSPPAPPVMPRAAKDPSTSGGSTSGGRGEMLASMPVHPAPRNRVVISEKVASLQIQPNGLYQREREPREHLKGPPVPRKRTNKSSQEPIPAQPPPGPIHSEPKAIPTTTSNSNSRQMSKTEEEGGRDQGAALGGPSPSFLDSTHHAHHHRTFKERQVQALP